AIRTHLLSSARLAPAATPRIQPSPSSAPLPLPGIATSNLSGLPAQPLWRGGREPQGTDKVSSDGRQRVAAALPHYDRPCLPRQRQGQLPDRHSARSQKVLKSAARPIEC